MTGCTGGDGDDYLEGDIGKDKLFGSAGNDVLVGGALLDLFDGGDGDDQIVNADGIPGESVDCGAGVDDAEADGDSLVNCEL